MDAHLRGVDDEIRCAGNRLQQPALGGDRVAQTDVAGDQGMLAAGLGIALEQHLVGGVQINDFAADAASLNTLSASAVMLHLLKPKKTM